MFPLWSIIAGLAQAQVPPPITGSAGGTCGALCDLTATLVNGGAVVAGIAAIAVSLLWHRSAVASAASNWQGDTISWGRLWLMPLLGAAGTICLVALALIGLGLAKPDFLTLLLIDWQQPLGVGLWVAALVGGVAGPPALAQITSGSPSNASIKG